MHTRAHTSLARLHTMCTQTYLRMCGMFSNTYSHQVERGGRRGGGGDRRREGGWDAKDLGWDDDEEDA
jgi:hypothetical protein